MVSVNIRRFVKQDLRNVQMIRKLVFGYPQNNLLDMYQYCFNKIPTRIKWFLLERIPSTIVTDRVDTRVFVAEADRKLVGFVRLFYVGNDVWEISLLLVHPNFRRRDIGSKLMTATLLYAKEHNGKAITLSVRIKNKKAIKFYKKSGFREIRTVHRMRLDLA